MSKLGREERPIQNSNMKVIFAKGSFGKGPICQREKFITQLSHIPSLTEGPSRIGRMRGGGDQQVSSSQGAYAPCFVPLAVMMRDASDVPLALSCTETREGRHGERMHLPIPVCAKGAKAGPPLKPGVCAQLSPDFLSVSLALLLVSFSEESPDC